MSDTDDSFNGSDYLEPSTSEVKLPNVIYAQSLAQAHFEEIKELIEDIKHPKTNKLIHQLMPNKLRRRATSQNPKRLPRRYRETHIKQMLKSGNPRKNKRPSRKYRRRPTNVLKSYARRMRRFSWLETHLWHAKRFHMKQLWGYKIPWTPCDRKCRAAYRAVAKHCLIQDISYHGCIEVRGPLAVLSAGFYRICSQQCGLTFMARAFIDGRRDGSTIVFSKDSYPLRALGRVQFLWKPLENEKEIDEPGVERVIWIWAHPLIYSKLVKELVDVFELTVTAKPQPTEEERAFLKAENVEEVDVEMKNLEPMDVEDVKEKVVQEITGLNRKQREKAKRADDKKTFVTKNYVFRSNRRYSNQDSAVHLVELKDCLNRFRLTGPLSHAVLQEAIRIYKPSADKSIQTWFNSFNAKKPQKKTHEQHSDYWNISRQAMSPDLLDPYVVLALNIVDPRITRLQTRTKPKQSSISDISSLVMPKSAPHSPLWDENFRETLINNMMSTHDFNTRRNKEMFVPGMPAPFDAELQPVPLILLQRVGNRDCDWKKPGFGSGWDVIVPLGYGHPLWLNLIQCSAQAGGARDTLAIHSELGYEEFEPDTEAGVHENARNCLERTLKYFKLPTNKRINYTKFAIAKPFSCPWRQLLSEWCDTGPVNEFHVTRDREQLVKIQQAIKRRFNIYTAELTDNTLVPVKLTMLGRGNPGDFAIICLPTHGDLKQNIRNIKFKDEKPVYTEPLRKDPNENRRTKLRIQHKKLLKRLRNRRVTIKRKKQMWMTKPVKIDPPGTATIVKEQLEQMCDLWLPPKPESIRYQCSRQTIGYIVRSTFALSEGKVTAIGYLAAKGLEKLFQVVSRGLVICLVRGTDTRHYRFASISINVNS